MIAIFVSQCEKKAINRTALVLDSFANRIGNRTWKTIITQEGLLVVKKLLKKTASKNTSIACHIIHSNKNIKLAWIVGRRANFSFTGEVPVNYTTKEIINTNLENRWPYLPVIKDLTALAALFHDFGKSSTMFQDKLTKPTFLKDQYRHEFVSCLILVAIDDECGHNFEKLLLKIVEDKIDYKEIVTTIPKLVSREKPFQNVSDFTFLLIWLILSHHKLPTDEEPKIWNGTDRNNLVSLKTIIDSTWGYYSPNMDEFELTFHAGLPSDSKVWKKNLQKWASRSLDDFFLFQEGLESGVFRLILIYSRLALILGDHLYSSKERSEKWKPEIDLYANTSRSGELNQYLDEHLVGVSKEALKIVAKIPRLALDYEKVENNQVLGQSAPPQSPFSWQDKAVRSVLNWKEKNSTSSNDSSIGFFAVCIASTGMGKTFANAKIMQALSDDSRSLRYSLGLGLRTLTLQTGDEYRNRIGLDDTELGVVIGSKAVKTLHQLKNWEDDVREVDQNHKLFDGLVDYDMPIEDEALSFLLKDSESKKILISPVLACTIDYLMLSTEIIRGGRWILPFLRGLSSDFVIDEIDDFTGDDLIAIGRLIHLAGLLGRKVLISSATIPPDMAEGYFRLYLDGFKQYKKFHNEKLSNLGCGWFDEFSSMVHTVVTEEDYKNKHAKFCKKRIGNIINKESTDGVRRKAKLIDCNSVFLFEEYEKRREVYYTIILNEVAELHADNFTLDQVSGRKVSFGCVRVANINRCIELFKFLINKANSSEMELKVMAYHSRQLLLLRSAQEKHLDEVLPCINGTREEALKNTIIRSHIDKSSKNNILFIVVCTPVEEIGRDHDFDWAVVEPSSFRSIIQMAGRVRRHRTQGVSEANVGLLQYNLKGLHPNYSGAIFNRPGYEDEYYRLKSKNLFELINQQQIEESINSIPRLWIQEDLDFADSLINLEHFVTRKLLNDTTLKGPSTVSGWMDNSSWAITGLPQVLTPFRKEMQKTKTVIDIYNGRNRFFAIEDGNSILTVENILKIKRVSINHEDENSLWLKRDYIDEVSRLSEALDMPYEKCSIRFGEIEIPDEGEFSYSDDFGMELRKGDI